MRRYVWGTVVALVAALCLTCGGGGTTTPSPTQPPVSNPPIDPNPTGPTEVLVGAGDIANCDNDGGRPAEATAKLLDGIAGSVFMAGDIAYPYSSAERLTNCYQPRWGRHKGRTRAAVGNHEYETPVVGPEPYFDYFGAAAGPSGLGFYSYDLGTWHIIVLNSNGQVPSGVGTPQWSWLRDDLMASRAKCTLAYWHHPRFTSGPSGGGVMSEAWRLLGEFNADVIVNGHDHFYERFARQDTDARRDTSAAIRQFTVGSGGAQLYQFVSVQPNSEIRIATYGVIKLTLRPGGYDWNFIEAGSGAVLDVGSEACH